MSRKRKRPAPKPTKQQKALSRAAKTQGEAVAAVIKEIHPRLEAGEMRASLEAVRLAVLRWANTPTEVEEAVRSPSNSPEENLEFIEFLLSWRALRATTLMIEPEMIDSPAAKSSDAALYGKRGGRLKAR